MMREANSEKKRRSTPAETGDTEQKIKDEDLVRMAGEGDAEAETLLLTRYHSAVKREVRYFYLVGAATEDLIQEAMIGLVRAIREYDPKVGAAFHTFATECIRNQLRSAVRTANRKKHSPLNYYMPIDEGTEGPGGRELIEQIEDTTNPDPEQMLIERERVEEIYLQMEQKLSKLEYRIALLFLQGKSHREIAEIVGRPERSVNNAMTRIRKKMCQ